MPKRSYTVGETARLAGVTIRTLHHYGEIGLLIPSGRTEEGYRRYSGADLDRLTRILYYRELGFPLDQIKALLDDPSANLTDHLRRQRALLVTNRDRLETVIAAVDKELNATMTGINLTAEEKLEIFGKDYKEEWEQEAAERWGETEAYKQTQQITANYTKDDWQTLADRMRETHDGIVAVYQSGVAPESPEGMAAAEKHRQWVSTHWDCTPEAHRNLVDMYLADPRFTRTYEDMAAGLSQWLHGAAYANAARQDASEA